MMERMIYMAVTPDRYELPLGVYDKATDMAKVFGVTASTVHSSISRKTSGKMTGVKFIKIKEDLD